MTDKALSAADLDLLRKYDTPTICNVVELFELQRPIRRDARLDGHRVDIDAFEIGRTGAVPILGRQGETDEDLFSHALHDQLRRRLGHAQERRHRRSLRTAAGHLRHERQTGEQRREAPGQGHRM